MAEMSHFLDDAHKSCISRKNKKSPRCCLDSMTVDLNQIPGFEFIQQVSLSTFFAVVCLLTAQRARKFKKVQAKKLVKPNIAKKIFL